MALDFLILMLILEIEELLLLERILRILLYLLVVVLILDMEDDIIIMVYIMNVLVLMKEVSLGRGNLKPICKVCKKMGHTSDVCYYRYV